MLSRTLSSIVKQPLIGMDRNIAGIAIDSRKVKPDFLFLAMQGEKQDGHSFISQAIANGAVAIALENESLVHQGDDVTFVVISDLRAEMGYIASRFYDDPSGSLTVVGVTGTNGKTSVTHYICHLLKMLEKKCAVVGTLGVDWNGEHLETENTTPDAITLHKSFHQMLKDDVSVVAMEVSSHGLEQQRCNGIHFDTAIMTNITHDHLDYHDSFDAYVQAKMKLFAMPGLRLAIVNKDDNSYGRIQKSLPSNVKLVSYSIHDSSSDVYLSNVISSHKGYEAVLNYNKQQYHFSIQLLGEFNLHNALAAIIALCEQGFDMQSVLSAATMLKGVGGRMQLVANDHNIMAVVDYAHTPDALENVLKSIRQQVQGRIIVVFGCGGDRDRAKRSNMAAIGEKLADYVVLTSDNPRSEKPEDILAEMKAGMSGSDYSVISARDKAIFYAVNYARPGDCVLVAGKGHEKTQIIGDKIYPFDDVEVLSGALSAWEGNPC